MGSEDTCSHCGGQHKGPCGVAEATESILRGGFEREKGVLGMNGDYAYVSDGSGLRHGHVGGHIKVDDEGLLRFVEGPPKLVLPRATES